TPTPERSAPSHGPHLSRRRILCGPSTPSPALRAPRASPDWPPAPDGPLRWLAQRGRVRSTTPALGPAHRFSLLQILQNVVVRPALVRVERVVAGCREPLARARL